MSLKTIGSIAIHSEQLLKPVAQQKAVYIAVPVQPKVLHHRAICHWIMDMLMMDL